MASHVLQDGHPRLHCGEPEGGIAPSLNLLCLAACLWGRLHSLQPFLPSIDHPSALGEGHLLRDSTDRCRPWEATTQEDGI